MAAIVVLSGGVGGARFLRGLVDVVEPSSLTVIGNVGDDVEVLGLHVSPDLDSILYALAGVADEERGWGRADESWRAMEVVSDLGDEAWFQLGDRDLGLHLVRTEALRGGQPLSAVTARLTTSLGVAVALLPATGVPIVPNTSNRLSVGSRRASYQMSPTCPCESVTSRGSAWAATTSSGRSAPLSPSFSSLTTRAFAVASTWNVVRQVAP